MSTVDIPEYAVEANMFQPVTPTLSGTAHTTGVLFAVMFDTARPVLADFSTATTVGQEIGVMTGGHTQLGTYYVWYRITDVSPEQPWVPCGPTFRLI